jgi:hypothetical protein
MEFENADTDLDLEGEQEGHGSSTRNGITRNGIIQPIEAAAAEVDQPAEDPGSQPAGEYAEESEDSEGAQLVSAEGDEYECGAVGRGKARGTPAFCRDPAYLALKDKVRRRWRIDAGRREADTYGETLFKCRGSMANFPMCDTETAVKLKYVGKIPGMLLQAAKVDQLYPELVKPARHTRRRRTLPQCTRRRFSQCLCQVAEDKNVWTYEKCLDVFKALEEAMKH